MTTDRQCSFDPMAEAYIGAPIGMFHCPLCGEMVLAGMPHPDYSIWDMIDEVEPSPQPSCQSSSCD
jgi:hypothetical protein